MFCIELAFGHTRANGEVLPDSDIDLAEQQVLTFFAQCFGGGQRYRPLGSYRAADNQVIVELCTVIRAFSHEVKAHWDALHDLAYRIADVLKQACVLLSIVQVDGSLSLIEPHSH